MLYTLGKYKINKDRLCGVRVPHLKPLRGGNATFPVKNQAFKKRFTACLLTTLGCKDLHDWPISQSPATPILPPQIPIKMLHTASCILTVKKCGCSYCH